ncbi:hypothetical protein RRG08_015750 [Elysia crispata]|uniref:Uncharacterized protein n=1 Tax=Elysia crispata TaxID=231223 RepID=A0AAE0YS05_9GAST|nr:hypothetical protein RRG08_015750 [Elysia crispata]
MFQLNMSTSSHHKNPGLECPICDIGIDYKQRPNWIDVEQTLATCWDRYYTTITAPATLWLWLTVIGVIHINKASGRCGLDRCLKPSFATPPPKVII